ncbi:MAG: hypothetical protein A2033_06920 [Bacteroidetes bacterium GWA2_31_9]|nr:MAG: hypothetical protein A2033_06920 [Bacteroidetes bacterium GWA2_31_9]
MNLKDLKSLSLLLLASGVLLISCGKDKITYNKTPAPNPLVIPIDGNNECENCHNATYPEHATNAHSKHTNGIYTFACSTCHFGHGYDTGTHMNATKNVTFDPNGLASRKGLDSNTPTWDSTLKTCSNVYCHSNGVTADRGTDGTNTWATGATPFATVDYKTTPSWVSGKIDNCVFCHNGKGNMNSPYTVERPNTLIQGDYPASGSHQMGAHMSNSKEFAAAPYDINPKWDGVQCFWCHNTNTDTSVSSVNGSNTQGTYGTDYHVDGATFFKPTKVSDGGTMLEGYGTNGHCGGSMKCWSN